MSLGCKSDGLSCQQLLSCYVLSPFPQREDIHSFRVCFTMQWDKMFSKEVIHWIFQKSYNFHILLDLLWKYQKKSFTIPASLLWNKQFLADNQSVSATSLTKPGSAILSLCSKIQLKQVKPGYVCGREYLKNTSKYAHLENKINALWVLCYGLTFFPPLVLCTI